MKNLQQQLVRAVQSQSIRRLALILDEFKRTYPVEGLRYPHINQPLPQLDVTALHVASRAYAVFFTDAKKRETFNTMVGMLLDAGADYQLCQRSITKGFTHGKSYHRYEQDGVSVWELCEGRVPPALQAHIFQRNLPVPNARRARHSPRVHEDFLDDATDEPSADEAYLACLRKDVA